MTTHSERSLLGHLFSDILQEKDGYIITELVSKLRLIVTKEKCLSITFQQIWLEMFSTRDVCTNCNNLLSGENKEIIDKII